MYPGDHPSDALGRAARRVEMSGAISIGGGVGVERRGGREKPTYAVVHRDGSSTAPGPLAAVTRAFGKAGQMEHPSTPGGKRVVKDPSAAARLHELESEERRAREILAAPQNGSVLASSYDQRRRAEAAETLRTCARERAKLLRAERTTTSLSERAEVGKPGTNWIQVPPGARKKIDPIVRHYRDKPKPFTACVADNLKRFGPERVKRVCAVVKDMGHPGTGWRKGGSKKLREEDIPTRVELLELGREARARLDVVEETAGLGSVQQLIAGALENRTVCPDCSRVQPGIHEECADCEGDLSEARVMESALAGAVELGEQLYGDLMLAWAADDEGKWADVVTEGAERGWEIRLAGGERRRLMVGYAIHPVLANSEVVEAFAEDLHPRDPIGQFRKKVGGLKPGHVAKLPDGSGVRRIDDVPEPGRSGGRLPADAADRATRYVPVDKLGADSTPRPYSSAHNAADRALSLSATKSGDPKAFGGAKSHSSIEAAAKEHSVNVNAKRFSEGKPPLLPGTRKSRSENEAHAAAKSKVRSMKPGEQITLAKGTPIDKLSNGVIVVAGQNVGRDLDAAAKAAIAYEKGPGGSPKKKVREGEVEEAKRKGGPVVDTPFERAMERVKKTEQASGSSNSNPDFNSKHPRGGKGTSVGGKFVRKGSTGEEVRAIQEKTGVSDPGGKFGDKTERAVRAFQTKHGLKVDGVVGRQTATALLGDSEKAKGMKTGALGDNQRNALKKASSGKKRKPPKPAKRSSGGILASVSEVADTPARPSPAEPVAEGFREWLESMVARVPRGMKGGGRFAKKGGGSSAVTPDSLISRRMPLPRVRAERVPLHRLPRIPEADLPKHVGTGPWTPRATHAVEAIRKGAAKDTEAVHKQDGFFRSERIALHNRQIQLQLQGAGHHPEDAEAIFLVGGPGSGKTEGLVKSGVIGIPEDRVDVNPDINKTMLPEYEPLKKVDAQTAAGRVHEESSFVSKKLAGIAYGRKHHVLFDAVGDSEKGKYLKKIRAAQAHGHKVRVAYAAQDEEKAWQFAKARAKQTGRHVNEGFFRAAHRDVRQRLREDILPAKDIPVEIWDTTKHGKPRLIARREAGGELVVSDRKAFDGWLKTGRIG